MWTILWILLSFFAVIGIVEFVFSLIESFSMVRTRSIEEVSLTVHMKGEEEHVGFILSSLSIMAERISINRNVAKVKIYDAGMSEETRRAVKEYIRENESVILIENKTDM